MVIIVYKVAGWNFVKIYLLQIGFGDGTHGCWIMNDKKSRSCASVSNTLITSNQYRRFWITWSGELIKLGCDGEANPIVKLINEFPDLNCVGFGVLTRRNPVEWRLECEFRAMHVLYSCL